MTSAQRADTVESSAGFTRATPVRFALDLAASPTVCGAAEVPDPSFGIHPPSLCQTRIRWPLVLLIWYPLNRSIYEFDQPCRCQLRTWSRISNVTHRRFVSTPEMSEPDTFVIGR